MQLSPKNLSHHLQQTLLPLYWLNGNEQLLLNEAGDAIRCAAKKQGFEQREVYHVDAGFDWRKIILAANTMSLFADKSIIEIKLGEKALSDVGKKSLLHYLKAPAADKIILIISDKLPSATLKTKWFKELEQYSGMMSIGAINATELPAWIKNRAQKIGLMIEDEGIRLLAELGEGNLLAVQQAMEKLNLLYPNEKITMLQIQQTITDNARFNLFSLTDAALAGDRKRGLRILRGLRQEGTETILILWALVREIRMLAVVSEITDTQPIDAVLRAQGVWSNRMALVKQALRRQPNNYWEKLLKQCFQLDLMIKGVLSGNVFDELENLLLKI